jgi:protein-tyrosine-phosphatase
MKILFLCKYNILRSKVAEVYFKKINKNSKIKVSSAGFMKWGSPLYKKEIEVLNELGIKITGKPRTLGKRLLDAQDLVIIVADDVPKEMIKTKENNKKIIVWNVMDTNAKTDKVIIRKIINKIIKRVDILVKDLENKK